MELQEIQINDETSTSAENSEVVELHDLSAENTEVVELDDLSLSTVEPTVTPIGADQNSKKENKAKHKKRKKEQLTKRYGNLNLGILQIIIFQFFQRTAFAIKTTLAITIIISIIDVISDYVVFTEVINQERIILAVILFVIDYVPGWLILFHNIMSGRWKAVKSTKHRILLAIFLFFSPFSMALTHIAWLLNFNTTDEELFIFLHHSSKLSQIASGSFESPLQITILMYFWGKGYFPLPWQSEFQLKDSQGNIIVLKKGLFSLVLSAISLLKAFTFDTPQTYSWSEKFEVLIFAVTNILFRILSYTNIVLYFEEWYVWVALPIFIIIINTAVIVRFEDGDWKKSSSFTSVVVSMFVPTIVSEQPHEVQYRDFKIPENELKLIISKKQNFTTKIAFITLPIIYLFDAIVFLVLKYSNFKKNDLVVKEKYVEFGEYIFVQMLTPLFVCSLIASILHRKSIKDINDIKLKDTKVDTNSGDTFNGRVIYHQYVTGFMSYVMSLLAQVLSFFKIVSMFMCLVGVCLTFAYTAINLKDVLSTNSTQSINERMPIMQGKKTV